MVSPPTFPIQCLLLHAADADFASTDCSLAKPGQRSGTHRGLCQTYGDFANASLATNFVLLNFELQLIPWPENATGREVKAGLRERDSNPGPPRLQAAQTDRGHTKRLGMEADKVTPAEL